MDLLKTSKVVGAGTFNGYPLGVAAALTTMSILEAGNGDYYKSVNQIQKRLMVGLSDLGRRLGLKILVHGVCGLFVIHFTEKEQVFSIRDLRGSDSALPNRLRSLLAEEGVLIMWGGRWYLTMAHTGVDVDETLEKAERAFKRL
jgi:glutamate-1-semialdehyde 2,1-aminomutase